MKHAKDLLGTPTKDVVQIEYNGVRYLATEEDCRHLQTLVIDGKVNAADYKIIDIWPEYEDTRKGHVEAEEYEISVDPKTGLLTNSLQSNTFSFNGEFTKRVMKYNRDIKKKVKPTTL